MSKTVIKVAIVSDVVCPWCYIGKRRFENAVRAVSNDFDLEIAYYPFELNPDVPAEGYNNKEYLSKKFGGDDAYNRITGQVTKVAQAEGLDFNFEKQHVAPNTRDAHRLILFAREENKQGPVVEALFKAYFTDGVDLSKRGNLIQVAVNAGLTQSNVEKYLESDSGLTEVIVAERELQKMGITGVPFYIVNDKYGISGAQPTETFINAFRNIAIQASAATEDAQACDVDSRNC